MAPTTTDPKSLDALAAEANSAHRQSVRAARESVAHALRSGAALTEAKARVREEFGHGHWQAWVEENFEGSVRTQQLYMRLARDPAKTQALAFLGLEGIDKALRSRGPRPRPEPVFPVTTNGRLPWWTGQQAFEMVRIDRWVREAMTLSVADVLANCYDLASEADREVLERNHDLVFRRVQIAANAYLEQFFPPNCYLPNWPWPPHAR